MAKQFPIYIPSKGRANTSYTAKNLLWMGIDDFHIIVEEQEYDDYAKVFDEKNLLILDKAYQDNYDTLDDLGYEKSKGPGAARNFAWQHSIDAGYDWHWVMDDNIFCFYRRNDSRVHRVQDSVYFQCMEDFCLRFDNVAMAGPHYKMFIPDRQPFPPYFLNTRIYSCNLIRNDVPFRWRGRYNEDTILSLDMLKAGWCTVQFIAFLQDKATTQTVKGGNNADFYEKYGTYDKSKMLVDAHPDVAKMMYRFGREHHYVDYSSFKTEPKYKDGVIPIDGNNEYGMHLVHTGDKHNCWKV